MVMYDTRDMQLLDEALARYHLLINRPYLYQLSCFSIPPLAPCTLPIALLQLVPFPSSPSPQYFTFILNALHGLHQTIGLIICSSPQGLTAYIGLKGDSCCSDALELLKSGIHQIFPETTLLEVSDPYARLAQLFAPTNYEMVSSATVLLPDLATISAPNSFMNTFIQLNGPSQPYLSIFLASSFKRELVISSLQELYQLYHTLSLFDQASYNVSENVAKNSSQTIAQGTNDSDGTTHNLTEGTSKSCNRGTYANVSGSAPLLYGDNKSISVSLLQNKAQATVDAENHSQSEGTSRTSSQSYTQTRLSATNRVHNHAINFSQEQKEVKTALSKIDDQITRLQSLLDTSCFAFDAYFLSSSREMSLRASYNFSGLCNTLISPDTPHAVHAINSWPAASSYYPCLLNHLQVLDAPMFYDGSDYYASSLLTAPSEFINLLFL